MSDIKSSLDKIKNIPKDPIYITQKELCLRK